LNPKGKVIKSFVAKKEGIFYFDSNLVGMFEFRFSNDKWVEGKSVTLALHCGNSTDEVLRGQHLSKYEKRLTKQDKKMKDLIVETKFSFQRQETHYKSEFFINDWVAVEKLHFKLFLFTMLESVGVLAATFWQIYYIKRLLDDRRLV
jgi:p24 family protein beta-1